MRKKPLQRKKSRKLNIVNIIKNIVSEAPFPRILQAQKNPRIIHGNEEIQVTVATMAQYIFISHDGCVH